MLQQGHMKHLAHPPPRKRPKCIYFLTLKHERSSPKDAEQALVEESGPQSQRSSSNGLQPIGVCSCQLFALLQPEQCIDLIHHETWDWEDESHPTELHNSAASPKKTT